MGPERLFSQDEAAELLQVSRLTLGKWLRDGRIRGVKIGRLWRIPESALDEIAKTGTRAKE